MVIHVNAKRSIVIDNTVMHDRLRPFIGTGVVLYGKGMMASDGTLSLQDINSEFWLLTD
ncbi:hypothetical protein J2T18_003566 [Paenibacillus polymyxa]|nr:hypothetical protein [Paenibacillus polymyxa]